MSKIKGGAHDCFCSQIYLFIWYLPNIHLMYVVTMGCWCYQDQFDSPATAA